MSHFALKCTYNDGGEGEFVGFVDTCSDEIIKYNIEGGRVWCSCDACKCRSYYDKDFRGKRPVNPCYESFMFLEWCYEAGSRMNDEPLHIKKAERDSIAILTTIFPGDKEQDRRVIGFFYVDNVETEEQEPTKIWANPELSIRLPLEEAKELFFWDYYNTKGGAKWGTGLFRYLSDDQVKRILLDLNETIRNEDQKDVISRVLKKGFRHVKPASVPGARNLPLEARKKRVYTSRKYGSGGEGACHKQLKEWIAKNPGYIGIKNVVRTEIEYAFPSYDVVDILFQTANGTFYVVEIETNNPLPGCYQSLKYNVLKCAEEGLKIQSPKVVSIVVAWDFDSDTSKFCGKYNIQAFKKRLK